jgi:protein TonB
MPLTGPRTGPLTRRQRKDALSGFSSRYRARRIRFAGLISLLIHILVGVLLLVTIRREEKSELLPPPSAVTMLFESGRRSGPTLPEPGLQPVPAIPLPPAPPTEAPALPSPPVPPAVQPPPPPPSPAPPVTAQPSPPVVETPPLPPAESAPLPSPPPVPKPSPSPIRPPSRQAAPPKQSEFPAPTNFSFGGPSAAAPSPVRPRPAAHPPGTFDMSLGPASKGAENITPFGDRDDAEGADWRNALSRWVAQHAYYPEQARHEFQEGDAKVHVIAEPNGRVKMVELIGRSGSMWLDLALLALFRDAHIPPLPSGEREPIDFNFTMHYILIRPR